MILERAKRLSVSSALDLFAVCYWKNSAGNWWIYAPGAWTQKLRNHTVTEHANGTITVKELIEFDGRHGNPWCGYLTAGVWRDLL